MLDVLQPHRSFAIQRATQKVRFADDLEALWYLRQDILLALSEQISERDARRQMKTINHLFKGWLPSAMGPRLHQRFPA